MIEPREIMVETPQGPTRVWRKGRGKRLGVLAGVGGLPRWTPFLDALAESRQVIVPSLPGFPGGPSSEGLDSQLDWIVATRDAIVAADLEGADLVGLSIGGALAAEMAALWPSDTRSLTLVAPFGMFDESEPVADMFAQPPNGLPRLVSSKAEAFERFLAPPEGAERGEWEVVALRARVAAAGLVWPLGDTGLARRISRVVAPTLILWGEEDRVIPPSYARRFARALGTKARTKVIKGAGHVAEFDQPAAVAKAILAFIAD